MISTSCFAVFWKALDIFFKLRLVGWWTGEAFINDQGQLSDLAHIGPSKLWKTLLICVPVWHSLLPTILLTLGSRGGSDTQCP